MRRKQNGSAVGSAHGSHRGRSVRLSAGVRPPLRHPAASTSGYLSDSSLHNSASLSLALTSFKRGSHVAFIGPSAGAASWNEGLAGGHITGGNLSPAVMRAHSEWISVVCCQKHLERITQSGIHSPSRGPEDNSNLRHVSVSALKSFSLYFNARLV